MRDIAILKRSCLLLLGVAPAAAAQWPDSVAARYAKTEIRIPMRDGTQLFTAVYEPRDTSRRHAIMLTRTPYSVGPYGPTAYPRFLGPSPAFTKEGFIFVYQDVRGRFMSGGDFVHMTPWRDMTGARSTDESTDESTDAYDTIDWLVTHLTHHNGRVGIWGISYPGFFTAAALVNAHPALKAASPQAPQADWFLGDDVHHHGAFLLASAFEFFATSGLARPKPTTEHPAPFNFGTDDGYRFFLDMGPLSNADRLYLKGRAPFWDAMMAHGTDDAFWTARRVAPHLRDVTPAVLTVSGWYDANNLHGALLVHDAIDRQSHGTSNRIVLGPWSHGQWSRGTGDALGDLRFGSSTSDFFRDSIEFPFFKHYLEGGEDLTLPAATAFETGDNRWRRFDAWPPPGTTPRALYFHANGRLSLVPPTHDEGDAFDQYVSDPDAPVPFLERHDTGMTPDYMAYDQRFTSARPDVLVYQTEPLEADLTIAGSVRPTLFVSTSGTDSDWIVKLIDVHPDPASVDRTTNATTGGFQELVRGDVMRGKFRRSYSRPESFVPGKVAEVRFAMDDVLHTFKKGHRIMLHVQSSWFPLVDRNPQTFVDIYRANATDFVKATERVYRAAAQPSKVELPVLP